MGDLSYPGPAGHVAAEARAAPLAGSAGTGLFGLYVAAFLVSLDRAVFAPLIPALSRDFHETVGAVGLAVSAYTLPYGLFQLGYGPLGDRAGKLTVIRWTFLIFAFGTGLCGLAMTLPMLDLLRAVTGACAAAIIPLALAYIGDVVPYERRQPTITNLMGATSSGNALSAAFGGVIGQFLSWRALFGLYGVCALLIAVALFRASATGHIAPKTAATPANRQYGELLRLRRARFLYILVGLEGAFVYAGFTYLGAYLSHRFALDYFTIGLILAGYGTGTLLTSLVVRHALRRFGEANLILIGGLLLATGFLVLLVLPWWSVYVAPMLWMGAGFALFHSTLQTRATELVPSLRGTSVALFAFSLFLGSGIGTAVLGWLITAYGYGPTIAVSGGGMLVVTMLARRVW